MKTLVFIVLLAVTGVAPADVVRCVGTYKFAGRLLSNEVDIVLPEETEMDLHLALVDKERGEFDTRLSTVFKPVGKGIIEIDGKRHIFVLTRRPSSSNSLQGFYVDANYVLVIRADLWHEDKPFWMYDNYINKMKTGRCE